MDFSADWLTNAFKQMQLDNGYSYRLGFFTVQHRFIPRCAFSPTAAAPVLTSWFYQTPLYSIPFSLSREGDNLRYMYYGFGAYVVL